MPWWIIFFILFRASNHKIGHKKDYDEFSFTALRFHFTLTLGWKTRPSCSWLVLGQFLLLTKPKLSLNKLRAESALEPRGKSGQSIRQLSHNKTHRVPNKSSSSWQVAWTRELTMRERSFTGSWGMLSHKISFWKFKGSKMPFYELF